MNDDEWLAQRIAVKKARRTHEPRFRPAPRLEDDIDPVERLRNALDLNTEWVDMSFMDDANCRGLGVDRFFTQQGEDTRPAVSVCGSCVVRQECLDFAIANNELAGIWGGRTARQRRIARRAA